LADREPWMRETLRISQVVEVEAVVTLESRRVERVVTRGRFGVGIAYARKLLTTHAEPRVLERVGVRDPAERETG
jgi:hypothetical protein